MKVRVNVNEKQIWKQQGQEEILGRHTCSDKFILTTGCPENLPRAIIRLVFPTPGLPSNKTSNTSTHYVREKNLIVQREFFKDMGGLWSLYFFFIIIHQ